ncbi:MAG: dihydropteroate synthase [Haloferacaceae archaeon]
MRTVEAAGLPIGRDHPPRIMGVLNVSVESPYDPSVFADADGAAEHVERLVDEGADIVDVGLATANKRVEPLTASEERDRLDTACAAVERADADAVFSIETRYAEVAAAALDGPFEMVNDVCGFADPEMPAVCAERDAAVAKMASPPDLTRPGAVEETDWAERKSPEWAADADYVDTVYEALAQNGFTDKTIVDPAFGGWSEAKTREHDRETFRRLREFRGYGRPVLVSINRKSFLKEAVGRTTEEALPVSLGATALAVVRGADVVRTHDVAETRDAALIGHAFRRERTRHDGPVGVVERDARDPAEVRRHLDRLGARADAADAAGLRVYELDGLDEDRMNALFDAAEGTGAVVAPGRRERADAAVVVGRVSDVRQIAESLDSSPQTPLAAAFATIGRDL